MGQCGDGSTTRRSGSETRTHTEIRADKQCGDGSTTRRSGSETHTWTHTEIWDGNSVRTGLRPVPSGSETHTGPTQRFGPATVWRRVYDPSVRVRDPHRTHTEIWAGNSVATGLRPVDPGQRPGPTPDRHRDLGRQQCGDGSTTRRSGSETRTHTQPVRPGQRPGPTPDPHRDLGRQQCGDGSTTRRSGSETRTHT